jgi:hypothetical protein
MSLPRLLIDAARRLWRHPAQSLLTVGVRGLGLRSASVCALDRDTPALVHFKTESNQPLVAQRFGKPRRSLRSTRSTL